MLIALMYTDFAIDCVQRAGAKRRMTTGSQFTEAMNERLVDSDLSGDEQVEMTIGIGTCSVAKMKKEKKI